MDLKIFINGGGRCDVRFQKHHKFTKVLGLLRHNKLLPDSIKDDTISIQDLVRGKEFRADDMVKECVGEDNRGSINIVFDNNGQDNEEVKSP